MTYRAAIAILFPIALAVFAARASAATLVVDFKVPFSFEPPEADLFVELYKYPENAGCGTPPDLLVEHIATKQKSFRQEFKELDAGRYQLVLYTGPRHLALDAMRPGAFRHQEEFLLEETERILTKIYYKEFSLKATRGLESVLCSVRKEDGGPLAETSLDIYSYASEAGVYHHGTVTTDEDGAFHALDLLKYRTYQVRNGSTPLGALDPADPQTFMLTSFDRGVPDSFLSCVDLRSDQSSMVPPMKTAKVTAVVFTATWCEGSEEMMLSLAEEWQRDEFWRENLSLAFISLDHDIEAAREYLIREELQPFTTGWMGPLGTSDPMMTSYLMISRFPAMIVFAPRGGIIYRGDAESVNLSEMASKYSLLSTDTTALAE